MQSSCNTTQTTVGLPLSDHIVSQVICQHPSLHVRIVQGQMFCILTKYTVADQMLKFGGSRVISRQIYGVHKNSANPDIRQPLGRLTWAQISVCIHQRKLLLKWLVRPQMRTFSSSYF